LFCTLLFLSHGFGQKKPAPRRPFSTVVAEAKHASDANQLDKAIPLYREALAQRPTWTEGWWLLGTAHYDLGQFPECERALGRLVKLDPKNGTGHLMLGLCQFQLNRGEPALKHIQAASEIGIINDPQLIKVMLYHKGLLLLRAGQFESALDTLGRLAKQGSTAEEFHQALGMTMLRMKPSDAPPPGSPEAQVVSAIGQAQALAAEKRYDEARQQYQQIVQLSPDFPNIHYAYGRFLLDSRDVEDAIRQFEEEIKRDPNDVNARLQIAAVRYREDSAAGVPYAEQAVKLDPKLPLGHYLLGLLYLDTGRAAEAIPELETATKFFATESRVYFALASAYSKVGRKKEAAQARATFTRLNVKNAQTDSEQPAAMRDKPVGQSSAAPE
jgi:tetratricopeptide (TPR) repeat protein